MDDKQPAYCGLAQGPSGESIVQIKERMERLRALRKKTREEAVEEGKIICLHCEQKAEPHVVGSEFCCACAKGIEQRKKKITEGVKYRHHG